MSFLLSTPSWLDDILDRLFYSFYILLYQIFASILWAVDIVELFFRRMAGLEEVVNSSGEVIQGDLVLEFIQSDIVSTLFVSISVFALLLLIIFSFLAIVRSVYKEEKENAVRKVIGNMIKALITYMLVPTVCVLGIMFSSVILQGLDSATGNGTSSFANLMFTSAAYEANYMRSSDYTLDEKIVYINNLNQDLSDIGVSISVPVTEEDTYTSANEIDYLFQYNFPTMISGEHLYVDLIYTCAFTLGNFWKSEVFNPYYNYSFANCFYNITDISYIFGILASIFFAKAFLTLGFGCINRIYNLTILYLISPFLMAMFPFDDGEAMKKWKNDFISNVISLYASVVVINIMAQLLPLLYGITIFTGLASAFGLANAMLRLAFLIAAGNMMKDFIGMIGGYIGAKNAYADGQATQKAVGDEFKKLGETAVTIGAAVATGGGSMLASGKAAFTASRAAGGNIVKSGGKALGSGLWGGAKESVKMAKSIGMEKLNDENGVFNKGKSKFYGTEYGKAQLAKKERLKDVKDMKETADKAAKKELKDSQGAAQKDLKTAQIDEQKALAKQDAYKDVGSYKGGKSAVPEAVQKITKEIDGATGTDFNLAKINSALKNNDTETQQAIITELRASGKIDLANKFEAVSRVIVENELNITEKAKEQNQEQILDAKDRITKAQTDFAKAQTDFVEKSKDIEKMFKKDSLFMKELVQNILNGKNNEKELDPDKLAKTMEERMKKIVAGLGKDFDENDSKMTKKLDKMMEEFQSYFKSAKK